MLHFDCDYTRGAHPAILRRLAETNMEGTPGYGEDAWCASAREKLRAEAQCPEAAVHFLMGGTQANSAVIAALLRPWQGVIAPATGHINGHEAGAVEASGHKVIPLPQTAGKLSAETLRRYLTGFYADEAWTHIAEPGMVYISFPTEYGTLYTQAELDALHALCREYGLPLFIDGARLGYGLMAQTEVTLPSLARSCEAFTIGGTKVGALFGEAVLFPDPAPVSRFFTLMKQRGAVLAKGRLLGIQFDTLFTDGLYWRIAKNAIDRAAELRQILREKGCRFHIDSPTNQIFVVLENERLPRLAEGTTFSLWEPFDAEHSVIRLCTDWATTPEELAALAALL
ncbi:MAG: threonine aldolase family protein [bacterium]